MTTETSPALPLGSRRVHIDLARRAMVDARVYVHARTQEYPMREFRKNLDIIDWMEQADHRVRDLDIPCDRFHSDVVFRMAWAAAAAVEAARVIETMERTPYDLHEQRKADERALQQAAKDMFPPMGDLGEGNRG